MRLIWFLRASWKMTALGAPALRAGVSSYRTRLMTALGAPALRAGVSGYEKRLMIDLLWPEDQPAVSGQQPLIVPGHPRLGIRGLRMPYKSGDPDSGKRD